MLDYVWTDLAGNVIANGKTANVNLDTGVNKLPLKVTAVDGSVSTDRVDITVVDRTRSLLPKLSSPQSLSRFNIVDEGELGGIGPDGKASEWLLANESWHRRRGLRAAN